MTTIIKDGTGKGNTAKVNSQNRLFTNAVVLTDDTSKAQEGEAYIIITNIVSLTTDGESGILYLKNNETRDLIIELIGIQSGSSTGAAAVAIGSTILVRNPTGGTVVSDANEMLQTNRNYGSSNLLDIDAYKGGEGKTLTGGVESVIAISSFPGGGGFTTSLVLPKGSSLGIKVNPPTNNTNATVSYSLNVHLDGFND
jgi:hypothetical protein